MPSPFITGVIFIAFMFNVLPQVLGQELFLNDSLVNEYSYFIIDENKELGNGDTSYYQLHPGRLLHDTTFCYDGDNSIGLIFRFNRIGNELQQLDPYTLQVIHSLPYFANMNFPITFPVRGASGGEHTARHFEVKLEKGGQRLLIKSNLFHSAEFEVGSSKVSVSVFPYIIGLRLVLSVDGTHVPLLVGEAFEVNGSHCRFLDFDYIERSIRLEEAPLSLAAYGYKEGKKIKDFAGIWFDYSKGVPIKPYNLFHFWGEWCAPCIQRIPKDRVMFSRIDTQKVNIMNVAFLVGEGSLGKSEEAIREYDLPGFHCYDAGEKFIEPFNIENYPSMVLVSQDGKVLYRSDTVRNLRDKDYLELMQLLREKRVLNPK